MGGGGVEAKEGRGGGVSGVIRCNNCCIDNIAVAVVQELDQIGIRILCIDNIVVAVVQELD